MNSTINTLWMDLKLAIQDSMLNLVRLNLFNHVLALFRAKFFCNLVIRYPIFRWKLCKGSVCESVKKAQKVCTQEEPCDWQVARMAHV